MSHCVLMSHQPGATQGLTDFSTVSPDCPRGQQRTHSQPVCYDVPEGGRLPQRPLTVPGDRRGPMSIVSAAVWDIAGGGPKSKGMTANPGKLNCKRHRAPECDRTLGKK